MTSPARYLNRELSWLEFNQRVLDEAFRADVPLLERLRFLAISSMNLDEFFRVRVGGLLLLNWQGVNKPDPTGTTPKEQLAAIYERVDSMVAEQYACLLEHIEPHLAERKLVRIDPRRASSGAERFLHHVFRNDVYPVLTPLAVDRNEDFPLLANETLNLCVQLRPPGADGPEFAVIPLSRSLPRLISLPSGEESAYVLLETLVEVYVSEFFEGAEILECIPFRVTRNADISLQDEAYDLMSAMEDVLDARKYGDCVRLEVADRASEETLGFLREALNIAGQQVNRVPGPLDLSAFVKLADRQGLEDLKYESWPPQPSPQIHPLRSMFETIAEQDVLLYHPYESFEPIVRLLEESADDPDVLAIKQTLYRTSKNSPIVAALTRAAENGKHVTVVVELKARFDEARNIEWARRLEQAGAQVIYGVRRLKTHAKLCIVVRREPQGTVRYLHFGTGNYNETTSRIYSDASLLTADPDLGHDAVSLFNAITGYSQPQTFRKIRAAPIQLREALLEMIQAETERKRQGQEASISAKFNSLVDPHLIDALYEASEAGVKIRLNIRGICCLRPGVEGLSENISVVSIVDRFLEHARILLFHHGGEPRLFISSADWMPRNLDRRVELLVPIEDPSLRRRLTRILNAYFKDNVKACHLLPNGSYQSVTGRGAPVRAQQVLYDQACQAVASAEQERRLAFEPHRGESDK